VEDRVAKRVGIIGGMGPLATTAFHRLLVLNEAAPTDQAHVPVVVDADPRIPDRTSFLLGTGQDPRPALRASARRLADAGAEVLVMPCNTANIFAADITAETGLPLVPWFESAAAAVVARLDGLPQQCGLLATSGTVRTGIYGRILAQVGIAVLVPEEAEQELVMAAIYADDGVKATGAVSPDRRQGVLKAAKSLVDRGAEVLLLGCTELPLAIPASDPSWPRPTIDPAVEVARRTLVLAGAALTTERVST
jgi:aspartate racemase